MKLEMNKEQKKSVCLMAVKQKLGKIGIGQEVTKKYPDFAKGLKESNSASKIELLKEGSDANVSSNCDRVIKGIVAEIDRS